MYLLDYFYGKLEQCEKIDMSWLIFQPNVLVTFPFYKEVKEFKKEKRKQREKGKKRKKRIRALDVKEFWNIKGVQLKGQEKLLFSLTYG